MPGSPGISSVVSSSVPPAGFVGSHSLVRSPVSSVPSASSGCGVKESMV